MVEVRAGDGIDNMTVGYTPSQTELYAEEPHDYLFQRLSELVVRGEIPLAMELQNQAVRSALEAIYVKNPLLRERDYPAPRRPYKYSPVSRNLGRTFSAETSSSYQAARLAVDAREAVVQWSAFLNSGSADFLEPGSQESAQDWQCVAAHLNTTPRALLIKFNKVQLAKYTSSQYKMEGDELRDAIHTQMVMLPHSLMHIAWRAFPNSEDKSRLFSDTFGYADDPQVMSEIPFESVAARQAFENATRLIIGMQLTTSKKDEQHFANTLVEHAMTTSMIDNLEHASAFITTDAQLYDTAALYASEIGESLNVKSECLRVAVDSFRERFTKAVQEDARNRRSQKGQIEKRLACRQLLRSISSVHDAFLIELQCEIQSQAVMQGVILEDFSPESLDRLAALTNEKPLEELAVRVAEVEELLQEWAVEWVIAPSHTGSKGPRENRPTEQSAPKGPPEKSRRDGVEYDPERVEWLKRYGRMWGHGAIVRSKIPNLPKHSQYYLALLPEELPNGTVIWHGLADNEQVGKHAFLFFNGYGGVDRYGRVRKTWDRVFKLYKGEIRDTIGVVALNHTPSMRDRIIDLIYMRPDRVPRYEEYGGVALRRSELV